MLTLHGKGLLPRRGRIIYRGPSTARIVLPAWCGYLSRKGVQIPSIVVPIMTMDGGAVDWMWHGDEILAVNGGCGYGNTLVIDGGADNIIIIIGYYAEDYARDEAYDVRGSNG